MLPLPAPTLQAMMPLDSSQALYRASASMRGGKCSCAIERRSINQSKLPLSLALVALSLVSTWASSDTSDMKRGGKLPAFMQLRLPVEPDAPFIAFPPPGRLIWRPQQWYNGLLCQRATPHGTVHWASHIDSQLLQKHIFCQWCVRGSGNLENWMTGLNFVENGWMGLLKLVASLFDAFACSCWDAYLPRTSCWPEHVNTTSDCTPRAPGPSVVPPVVDSKDLYGHQGTEARALGAPGWIPHWHRTVYSERKWKSKQNKLIISLVLCIWNCPERWIGMEGSQSLAAVATHSAPQHIKRHRLKWLRFLWSYYGSWRKPRTHTVK